MDPMNSHTNRLPAFEDTDAYRTMCAQRHTTPLERAPGGLTYTLPGLPDDPALPPLSELDGEARRLYALREHT